MMKKIGDAKFTIKDVPVNHYDRQHGESQFFNPKRVIKTLWGLISLWINIVLLRKGKKKSVRKE